MNIFAGSEIVELGIQIEKNGRDFYNALVEQLKNQKAKETFKYLAGEEEKHIAVFQNILDSVHKYEPPESYPGEYFAYMNALARDYVFTQKDKGREIAKNVKGDKEAISLGIGFEKDSIIFYVGMKKVVPEYDHKIVDRLITQEQDHLRQLSELKESL
ncbi:MAG TPA: ferritin family protein [bacterium]|nr:ferritin family protein [bacterium]